VTQGESAPSDPPWKEGAEAPLSQNPTGEAERENLFRTQEEKEHDRLRNISYGQDINQRKRYAIRSYRVTLYWVWFLIGISVLQLASKLAFSRGLETVEFVTIVTTTTGSVFGFWWLVGRYLFPRGGEPTPPRPPVFPPT
jgi:hypothetical protein